MNKVVYTDDVTVIEAQNLNDIQDAVIDTVPKSTGGTFGGNIGIDRKDGTTSATGTSSLVLGNASPTGTDKNSRGQIQIYGNGANYSVLRAANVTANRTVDLPDATGQIMLNTTGTFNNNVKVETSNTSTAQGYSNLTLGTNKAVGTAQNSRGQLYIYGNGTNYTIVRAPNATADRQCDFPDASGTLVVNQTGTWSPQLYDYETYKMTLTNNGVYVRLGSFVIFGFSVKIDSSLTFSQMLQVRGFPFSVAIFGGNMYCAGVTNNFADKTIQYANNAVYLRPNFTGTIGSGFWWSGCFLGSVL